MPGLIIWGRWPKESGSQFSERQDNRNLISIKKNYGKYEKFSLNLLKIWETNEIYEKNIKLSIKCSFCT